MANRKRDAGREAREKRLVAQPPLLVLRRLTQFWCWQCFSAARG